MDAHLRDLRYFVTVAEELNFTRAAERLYISQPALSKQIRLLEETLRVKLLVRDKRSVTLTAPGAVLLEAARSLLDTWGETQRAISDAAAAESAVLTLGVSTSVGRGILAGARSRFGERRPSWKLRVKQVNWTDPTTGLECGDVDAALVWLPLPPEHGLQLRVITTEPRWVAFRDDHWLAEHAETTFDALLCEPFLALPPDAGDLRSFWLALDERGGRAPVIGATVANAEETFAAVEEGSGIVLLAAGNAAIYQRPGIKAIPVTGLSPCSLALAWRAGDHRPALRDLVEAFRGPEGSG